MMPIMLSFTKWIDIVVGAFVRADRFSSSDELWFARSAFIYTYIGVLVALAYTAFYWTFASPGAAYSLGALSIILVATTPMHLFGKSRLLAKINLASTSFGLAGVVLHMGGVDSSAACWLLGVTPGLTALLFRRAKEIFQLTALTLCLYFGIFAAELLEYPVYQFAYSEGSVVERVYTFIHFAAFSIFIAVALAIFSSTQRKLLNKVERRAREIKAIMANIRQGIFTISSHELRLGVEYSDYLEDIIETKDIQNRNVMDLIFAASHLNSEQKDMTASILACCIQESALNFELNEDKLVRDLVFSTPDGREKILLIDWQPIVNERLDKIEKILVTLLDVTELKMMETQNKKQQKEIEMISEITELSHEAFERFMRDSVRFIAENRRIIESNTAHEDLKILFINMHTLKGSARTYRFKHMTAQIHDCEQYYAMVQKGDKAWDPGEAMEHLNGVQAICDEYAAVSRFKLKRAAVSDHLRVDREDVRENIRLLQNLEGVNIDHRVLPFIQKAKETFYGLYYMDVKAFFAELLQSLPLLAKDLNKLPPDVQFRADPIGLNAAGCEVVRNSFVHILRNSVDHGLEDTAVRIQKGKSAQGTIAIDIFVGPDQNLHIRYSDNGGGLELEKIFKIGVQAGLIDPQERDPQKVAELIFVPGLSTTKAVTDVSGRGVGMGAVREFFNQLGGRIEIHLQKRPERFEPTAFEFLLVLPPQYFVALGREKVVA